MFRMPAEWMPHARCWMIWPCRREVWGSRIDATKRGFAAVAHAVARFEPVTMIADPTDAVEARSALGLDIDVFEIPVDDSWARDQAPCFVHDGERLAASCFRFNAWGGKYAPFDRDAALGAALADELGVEARPIDLVAEGGAVSVDGAGTVLTTESCLLNANRNPDLSRAEVEARLHAALGTRKAVWLPGDVEEMETDGHVDGIAVFIGPGRVMAEAPADDNHPFAEAMHANLSALRAATDAEGRQLEVIEIGDAVSAEGEGPRFCRSYVNFYLANGAVIAPSYGIPEDAAARATLAGAFPDREIVQVDVNAIAIGGGGIHCITQQEPLLGPAWA